MNFASNHEISQVDHINNEKRLMAQISYPFIVNMMGYSKAGRDANSCCEVLNNVDDMRCSMQMYAGCISICLISLFVFAYIVSNHIKPSSFRSPSARQQGNSGRYNLSHVRVNPWLSGSNWLKNTFLSRRFQDCSKPL